jgi:hypothetical protein
MELKFSRVLELYWKDPGGRSDKRGARSWKRLRMNACRQRVAGDM